MTPIVWPGPARLTLVALIGVAVALSYPWESTDDRWLVGVGAVAVILVLGWWRGMHLTTAARRLAALPLRNRRSAPEDSGSNRIVASAADAQTTVVLRIAPPPYPVAVLPAGSANSTQFTDVLPLATIAEYLRRYGLRLQSIRITSRDTRAPAGSLRDRFATVLDGPLPQQRTTWIGVTLSAASNLAALQARSSAIPLRETAEVAARRLADHLRELGWLVRFVDQSDIASVLEPADGKESWRSVTRADGSSVAAYSVPVGAELGALLTAIWSYPADETWTALEIAGSGTGATMSVACAFRTTRAGDPTSPVAGLIPQYGNQRNALRALEPTSTTPLVAQRRAHRIEVLDDVWWPTGAPGIPFGHTASGAHVFLAPTHPDLATRAVVLGTKDFHADIVSRIALLGPSVIYTDVPDRWQQLVAVATPGQLRINPDPDAADTDIVVYDDIAPPADAESALLVHLTSVSGRPANASIVAEESHDGGGSFVLTTPDTSVVLSGR